MSLPTAIQKALQQSPTWNKLPKTVQEQMLQTLKNDSTTNHQDFLKMLAQSDFQMQQIDQQESKQNTQIINDLDGKIASLTHKAQKAEIETNENTEREAEIAKAEKLLKDL